MCGIAGIYNTGTDQPGFKDLEIMTESLLHRGPDDQGFLAIRTKDGRFLESGKAAELMHFSEKDCPDLWLGHRRLSILDLSEAGHQPMSIGNGLLWIVYNGEVYNYREIRKELEGMGHCFKSQTDTEIILHAYDEWGTNCLRRLNGMWAFAIVDLRAKRIFCARDRAGVKPFYYVYDGKRFCFASEIKALLKIEAITAEPNDQIIADYLLAGLLDHTKETFFRNIHQLRPSEYLLVEKGRLSIRSYWDVEVNEVHFPNPRDYEERFRELLEDSIQLRLRSDVPIGSCLSGGLDSTTIVCLANRLMFDGRSIDPRLVGERQKTFSSCFEESGYDERTFIEPVIQQTGAERNYVFPQAKKLFEEVSNLIWHQEEPFGSTSIYAQWNVMRKAKERGVTVLLDGQGADELLAGYLPSFYPFLGQMLKEMAFRRVIREFRAFRKGHQDIPNQFVRGIAANIIPRWLEPSLQRYITGRMRWADEGFRKKYSHHFAKPVKFAEDLNNHLYHIFRFTSLPGLLHYEDRNSMAFSVETRLPFLDYRLIEYIFSLPIEQKLREGVTKVILRNVMKGTLPEEVRSRMDKMGFGTPEDIWFRTVLREGVSEIIGSKSFAERGYFDARKVQQEFEDHCNGRINIGSQIWKWVNLELWLRMFIDRGSKAYKRRGNDSPM